MVKVQLCVRDEVKIMVNRLKVWERQRTQNQTVTENVEWTERNGSQLILSMHSFIFTGTVQFMLAPSFSAIVQKLSVRSEVTGVARAATMSINQQNDTEEWLVTQSVSKSTHTQTRTHSTSRISEQDSTSHTCMNMRVHTYTLNTGKISQHEQQKQIFAH